MYRRCVFCGWGRKQCRDSVRFYGIPAKAGLQRLQWMHVLGEKCKSGFKTSDSVCSLHFELGKPSTDPSHVDFVPTLYLEQNSVPSDVIRKSLRSVTEQKDEEPKKKTPRKSKYTTLMEKATGPALRRKMKRLETRRKKEEGEKVAEGGDQAEQAGSSGENAIEEVEVPEDPPAPPPPKVKKIETNDAVNKPQPPPHPPIMPVVTAPRIMPPHRTLPPRPNVPLPRPAPHPVRHYPPPIARQILSPNALPHQILEPSPPRRQILDPNAPRRQIFEPSAPRRQIFDPNAPRREILEPNPPPHRQFLAPSTPPRQRFASNPLPRQILAPQPPTPPRTPEIVFFDDDMVVEEVVIET